MGAHLSERPLPDACARLPVFHPDGPAAKSVPRTEHEQKRLDGTRFVFEDSVIPVEVAGQIVQWSQDYRVSDSLRLRAAEGHTPGSSVLWLDAGPQQCSSGTLPTAPFSYVDPRTPVRST